eukprot:UN26130
MSNVYVDFKKTNDLILSSVSNVTSEIMLQRILILNRLVVVNFSAEIPPALGIAPLYEKIARNNPSVVFILVENGKYGTPKYRNPSNKHNIRCYPTFVFFVNGKPLT